jgi:segregation and condensation protein B
MGFGVGAGLRTRNRCRAPSLVLLTAIAYFEPVTHGELSQLFGNEISRDVIGQLWTLKFIAAGPRSPQLGAPYTYVTTKEFLSRFGFDTRRDLPDMEQLEEAGLLSKQTLLADVLPADLSDRPDLRYEGEEGDLETEAPLALASEDL